MRFRAYTIAAAAILTFGVVGTARADEQIATLAVSGDWVAMAHHTSITAPPDVCIAAKDSQGIAFRADTDTVQLRIINEKWSLPPRPDRDDLPPASSRS